MAPEALSLRWDGIRVSSYSFPRQGWSQLSPSYVLDAGPSHHTTWSAVDESGILYHSTALHRSNRRPHPPSQENWTTNPGSERSATVSSQPVLVRAYSSNAENTTGRLSKMSPRRIFPLIGSKDPMPSHPSVPPLPSDREFSIESILQAIEPDIRGTLDSIAEICGRSKLSLANEYGSHIAPLGEIRAPPGRLVPVEEASATDERRADDSVLGDESRRVNAHHKSHLFSFYQYLENIRHAVSALERNSAPGTISSAQPNAAVPTLPTLASYPPGSARELNFEHLSAAREFTLRPNHSSRDLLATCAVDGYGNSRLPDIATPAMVSEVHLDAMSNACNLDSTNPYDLSNKEPATEGSSLSELVQSLIGWLSWTTRLTGSDNQLALQSAESQLRAMLERSTDSSTS